MINHKLKNIIYIAIGLETIIISYKFILWFYTLYNIVKIIDITNDIGSLRYYSVLQYNYINNFSKYDTNLNSTINNILYDIHKEVGYISIDSNNIFTGNYKYVYNEITTIINNMYIYINRRTDLYASISIILHVLQCTMYTFIILYINRIINVYDTNTNKLINDLKIYKTADDHTFHIIKNDYCIINGIISEKLLYSNDPDLKIINNTIKYGMESCKFRNIFYQILNNKYIIADKYVNLFIVLKYFGKHNIDIKNTNINRQYCCNIDVNVVKIILNNAISNAKKHGIFPIKLKLDIISDSLIFTLINQLGKVKYIDDKTIWDMGTTTGINCDGIGMYSIKLCSEYVGYISNIKFNNNNAIFKLTINNIQLKKIKDDQHNLIDHSLFTQSNKNLPNAIDKNNIPNLVNQSNNFTIGPSLSISKVNKISDINNKYKNNLYNNLIYILDDCPIIRKLTCNLLTCLDIPIITHGCDKNEIECSYDYIIDNNPLLVILDNNLGHPLITGLGIAKKLVYNNFMKEKIIICSGDNINKYKFIDKSIKASKKMNIIKNQIKLIKKMNYEIV